jgi:hypothetical protein
MPPPNKGRVVRAIARCVSDNDLSPGTILIIGLIRPNTY